MFLKNIKKIFKLKFPILSNKLISIRDNNKFFRSLNEGRDLDVNKNVHGKKLLKLITIKIIMIFFYLIHLDQNLKKIHLKTLSF